MEAIHELPCNVDVRPVLLMAVVEALRVPLKHATTVILLDTFIHLLDLTMVKII